MVSARSIRVCLAALSISAAGAANAFFIPVTVSGTAVGAFSGSTLGFSVAPGPAIHGTDQFYDTSSEYSGDVGYYGISPQLASGTFGEVSLLSPVSGTTVYSGLLTLNISFTSPVNLNQVFTGTVNGSITGKIVKGHNAATGGVTISFDQTPMVFNYGPGNMDWFSLTLNTITFGPQGGTQAVTGHGLTYTTPAPPGALVFLAGCLRRRRNRKRASSV